MILLVFTQNGGIISTWNLKTRGKKRGKTPATRSNFLQPIDWLTLLTTSCLLVLFQSWLNIWQSWWLKIHVLINFFCCRSNFLFLVRPIKSLRVYYWDIDVIQWLEQGTNYWGKGFAFHVHIMRAEWEATINGKLFKASHTIRKLERIWK